MRSYSTRTLCAQPVRSAITVGGIGLCILLILFLFAIYRGVSRGAVEHVSSIEADIWVLQKHRTNVLRSTSIMPESYVRAVRKVKGVLDAVPLLGLLVTCDSRSSEETATIYLAGYDLESGLGGPKLLASGRLPSRNYELMIDEALSKRLALGLGDTVWISDSAFTIVGVSQGTNMFVIQYGFASLPSVQSLTGLNANPLVPPLISSILVRTNGSINEVRDSILRALPGEVAVYDKMAFVENNRREMNAGVVPLLFTNALIGSTVLVTVLTLMLLITILERRRDLSVMKALGAPRGYLGTIIFGQSLSIALCAIILATLLIDPVLRLVSSIAPEVEGDVRLADTLLCAGGALVMACISAVIAIRRLRSIYPMEVFQQPDL